ncbi:adenylate/guanylate cyclase domain-containing protein [Dongia deserti]|uniref:adenylate/guanylate cyclase domain-containing protein n=1 Tax=Dongia deserti TaxID=2268030 RepID=UPI000E65CEF0|nr:adenylate/guanylate cyclase domain-containing protein [Dongia deserti]
MVEIAPLLAWLRGPGRRLIETEAFVEALGEQLVEIGLPIDRITTGIPMLHPQIASSSVVWEPERLAHERQWQLTSLTRSMYERSPLYVVYRGDGPVRVRVMPEPQPGEYGIIPDLREEGFTDYIALPAPFSDGTIKAMTFATRQGGGFADAEIAVLQELMPQFAYLLEIQTLRRTARVLLDTYVGRISGQRVLQGQIKRGQGEDIRAIIWFSDLRGFTELSDALSNEALIALLNDYFGALTRSVEEQQGEVLKFIGDAMLSIYPIATASSGRRAAQRSLASARAAQARIAEINQTRRNAQQPIIQWGLALHVGEVHYGNIGGETRLDFTVIGPSVNLAARLQSLSASLGESCLISDDFARLLTDRSELRDLGAHELKGIIEKRQVFGLA